MLPFPTELSGIANHLWQSTLFALAVAVVVWLLRHHSPRLRFALWTAASLKFLLPFALLQQLGAAASAWFTPSAALSYSLPPLMARASVPFRPALLNGAPAPSSATVLIVISLIWSAGSLALALRWLLAWRRLCSIARAATVMPGIAPGLTALAAEAAVEPGIFGILHPVLVLPAGIHDRLTPPQFNAVIAHELAHVRRRDNLWSALHMLAETLFWFHPFVWMIGARLITERERACDQAALAQGIETSDYATGVIEVCRFYVESPLACAAGISGGELKARLRQILDARPARRLGRLPAALLLLSAAAILALPLAAGALVHSLTPRGQSRSAFTLSSTRLTLSDVSVSQAIQLAYGLQPYQLQGPAWLESARFSLALQPGGASSIQLLQGRLQRTYRLAMHHEDVTRESFALVRTPAASTFWQPPPGKDGVRDIARFRLMDRQASIDGVVHTSQLAELLSRVLRRPVLDDTGLPADAVAHLHGLSAAPTPALWSQQLQQKLGLRLEPGRATIQVTVIDHASKPPQGN
ncbi:MAG TPA: TIGR03435 family protein [Terriglobales bacterium]|nr:TIGR03435 family protein [Terriglobales bacterium]